MITLHICRVKSRKPDQLINLITLRFLDFGIHGGINIINCIHGREQNVLKFRKIDQVYETLNGKKSNEMALDG